MVQETVVRIVLLFSLLVSTAYANDPFATLFGDEPVAEGSRHKKANQDDLLLVRFVIDEYLVDDGWVAYQTFDGICLPLQNFTDALELPFSYDSNLMNGWALSPEQGIELALAPGEGLHQTKNGWCGTISKLEKLLPVRLEYQASTLTLVVEPTQVLPIQARMQRQVARQELSGEANLPQANYPKVNNPYRWLSWPTMDISIDSKKTNSEKLQTVANVDLAADFLYMSARLRTVSNNAGLMNAKRLSLFRENTAPAELGWLKARRFAIGDISAPSQPLTTRSVSGRGFVLSNRPIFKPEEFDQTQIRGVLPAGWEAELYSDITLLDFVTTPDVNGEYVFNNVSLRPGFNRLSVKLYGPHGEEVVRNVDQFVGPELCPTKTLRYNVGYIEPLVSLFGDSQQNVQKNEQQNEQTLTPQTAQYGFASFDYGMSNKLSVRADIRAGSDHSYGSFSLIGSQFGGYGVLRMAVDEAGRNGWQAQFQKPISTATSFSVNAIDYGDLLTEVNGSDQDRTKQSFYGRLDSRLNIGRASWVMRNELNWLSKDNGTKQTSFFNRLSSSNRWLRWNNSLRYFNNSDSTDRWQGEFLASGLMMGTRLRSSMAYSYEDSFKVDNIALSFQNKFKKNIHLQNNLTYDFNTGKSSISSTLSRNFGRVSIITKGGYSEGGQWNLGIGISMSLYRNRNRFKLGPSGLSRSGVIMPRLFDDLNENGRFDNNESAISGGQFIVNNTLRKESGNTAGVTMVDALPTARHINAEVKTSSLADPFMRPSQTGRTMRLRPGQLLNYDVPVSVRGDADGVLKFRKNNIASPVANITIEAIDSEQRVVAIARTEYDGYFYFDDLPATKLSLRVAPQPLAEINGISDGVTIQLTRDNPSALGIELFVDML